MRITGETVRLIARETILAFGPIKGLLKNSKRSAAALGIY